METHIVSRMSTLFGTRGVSQLQLERLGTYGRRWPCWSSGSSHLLRLLRFVLQMHLVSVDLVEPVRLGLQVSLEVLDDALQLL